MEATAEVYCLPSWFSLGDGRTRYPPAIRDDMLELTARLGVDVCSAALTALAIAPLCAALDEAITRSASGEKLWCVLSSRLRGIIVEPRDFFGSTAFAWMWVVYAATYVVTNSLKSIEWAASIRLGFAATLLVTIANMSCGIAKDRAYAKLFGSKVAKDGSASTPLSAYLTWFLRDLVAFTFSAGLRPNSSPAAIHRIATPWRLSRSTRHSWSTRHVAAVLTLPPIIRSHNTALPEDVIRFMTPILAQYFTTPLHLLGFNMCNMPGAPFGTQLAAMKPILFSTVVARQMRIIPPYSIGGILNSKLLSAGPRLVRG